MLSRQHNFYQQFLQLVDAALICASLWIGHALRFYLINKVQWFDDYPMEPQFANCYWMIAIALPLGPLALEYMGFYQTQFPMTWLKSLREISLGLVIVLTAIFVCVMVFH